MKDCWQQEADKRPDFKEILKRLKEIKGKTGSVDSADSICLDSVNILIIFKSFLLVKE